MKHGFHFLLGRSWGAVLKKNQKDPVLLSLPSQQNHGYLYNFDKMVTVNHLPKTSDAVIRQLAQHS
uniref:Uncharacterized protein n=1 Tax=Arundo donax TaxID=35708 RepID=A0A0A9MII4_ARUDO